jgi:hypothetical protein
VEGVKEEEEAIPRSEIGRWVGKIVEGRRKWNTQLWCGGRGKKAGTRWVSATYVVEQDLFDGCNSSRTLVDGRVGEGRVDHIQILLGQTAVLVDPIYLDRRHIGWCWCGVAFSAYFTQVVFIWMK